MFYRLNSNLQKVVVMEGALSRVHVKFSSTPGLIEVKIYKGLFGCKNLRFKSGFFPQILYVRKPNKAMCESGVANIVSPVDATCTCTHTHTLTYALQSVASVCLHPIIDDRWVFQKAGLCRKCLIVKSQLLVRR